MAAEEVIRYHDLLQVDLSKYQPRPVLEYRGPRPRVIRKRRMSLKGFVMVGDRRLSVTVLIDRQELDQLLNAGGA